MINMMMLYSSRRIIGHVRLTSPFRGGYFRKNVPQNRLFSEIFQKISLNPCLEIEVFCSRQKRTNLVHKTHTPINLCDIVVVLILYYAVDLRLQLTFMINQGFEGLHFLLVKFLCVDPSQCNVRSNYDGFTPAG